MVFTDPPGATVYLDDEPLGETDPESGRLVKTRLRPGAKRVRASKAGFEDATHEVTLARTGPTEVRLSLVASPTVLSPLVVAILATAAAGLILLGWQRLRGRKAGAHGGRSASRSRPDPITERPPPTAAPRARRRGPAAAGGPGRSRASDSASTPCGSRWARAAWPRCTRPSGAASSWP